MYSDAITIEFIAYSNAKEALNSEQLDRMTRLRPFRWDDTYIEYETRKNKEKEALMLVRMNLLLLLLNSVIYWSIGVI